MKQLPSNQRVTQIAKLGRSLPTPSLGGRRGPIGFGRPGQPRINQGGRREGTARLWAAAAARPIPSLISRDFLGRGLGRERPQQVPGARVAALGYAGLLVSILAVGCTRPPSKPSPVASTTQVATAVALADAGTVDTGAPAPTKPQLPWDAGTIPSPCKLLYGPEEQPFRGPASIIVRDHVLELVQNDGGKPKILSIPIPPKDSKPPKPRTPSEFYAVSFPRCEVAALGTLALCQGKDKRIQSYVLGQSSDQGKLVATASNTASLALATSPSGKSLLGYLASRRTSEGSVLEAWGVLLDKGGAIDGESFRISEDGSGATTLDLSASGETFYAFYIDASMAMTPMHARTIELRAPSPPKLSEDAVVFVGAQPERGTSGALVQSGGQMIALATLAKDDNAFGMAAIPLAAPPKHDAIAAWSLYLRPTNLPSMAVSRNTKGILGNRVLRAVPTGNDRAGIEIGSVTGSSAFESQGLIKSEAPGLDLAIREDAEGTFWILYGDAKATWLERRACP
jgi:hypothetical protein